MFDGNQVCKIGKQKEVVCLGQDVSCKKIGKIHAKTVRKYVCESQEIFA